MNLYLLTQSIRDDYDTYDSAVVAALSAELARMTHPEGKDNWNGIADYSYSSWPNADQVTVTLIGTAIPDTQPGVVIASFNAG